MGAHFKVDKYVFDIFKWTFDDNGSGYCDDVDIDGGGE
jgi:hypothetical protein